MSDEMEVLTVGAEDGGQRLDQWMASASRSGLSRSRIKALIESDCVSIDGTVCREPRRKTVVGARVTVTLPPPAAAAPRAEAIALDILHEDADLIVVNKPPGLVVHPGAGTPDGTLVNALLHHCGDSLSGIGGVARPGLVHRLDKDTSGVMVVAKNDLAHRHLSAQFADHGRSGAMQRRYQALAWGEPTFNAQRIETHLGRSSSHRTKQAVVREDQPDARHAVTHARVTARYMLPGQSTPVAFMAECTLETGRTHQIRVHMAHIGHPIIGDDVYGSGFRTKSAVLPDAARSVIDSFRRQALHAFHLTFEHPVTGLVHAFEAPPPADMQAITDALSGLHKQPANP